MKFSKLISYLFFTFCWTTSNAQHSRKQLDSVVTSFMTSLNIRHIDTFLVYKEYCVGCIYSFKDTCDYSDLYVVTYIFWIDNGKTFMTIKDNCFDYSTIVISGNKIWPLALAKFDAINKEEIKPPEYIKIENNKVKIYSSVVDHSRQESIKIIVGSDTTKKYLNDYSFEKTIEGRKNINLKYNLNTYTKKLQLNLHKILLTLLNENKLTSKRR